MERNQNVHLKSVCELKDQMDLSTFQSNCIQVSLQNT